MKIFDLLRNDHQEVRALFGELEGTTHQELNRREELFRLLHQALETHATIEEVVFYPAIESAALTQEQIAEAYDDHIKVKDLLAELQLLQRNHIDWMEKLRILKENVEKHVAEEEGSIIPKAERLLTGEQAEALGLRAEELKVSTPAT